LSGNGETREARTNGFGDFEFEGLAENAAYTLKLEAAGYKARSVKATTQRDNYLGEIVLRKG
ncbi:MAG: hypothetical protein H6Q39_1032, partial [Chloroflexi bacterium]|nr:hypothetical protein [Chloroflexota bacterium]